MGALAGAAKGRRALVATLAGVVFAAFVSLGGLGGLGGCEASPCNPDPNAFPPADFRGGAVHTRPSGELVYESSPADGEHLNFSSGAQFRIHHGLGGRPMLVQPWVSFSSGGVDGGNEAVPAGNMVEIIEVTSDYVLVRNDSCADYWLRVIIGFPDRNDTVAPPPRRTSPDAGTD